MLFTLVVIVRPSLVSGLGSLASEKMGVRLASATAANELKRNLRLESKNSWSFLWAQNDALLFAEFIALRARLLYTIKPFFAPTY
jgi:hypothetical protein